MNKKIYTYLLTLLMMLSIALIALPSQSQAAISKYKWKESVAPNYVKVIGKAKVSGKPKKGTIKYSKLDSLGRTRRAVGVITYKMVADSAGWREEMGDDCNPSGWPNDNSIVKIPLYNGKQYKGYKWNRSHLIADSLGGRAKRENLITGTRMQNVGANDGKGGMAFTERKAVSWLNNHHKGWVYYSANPVYKDSELIPRSVIVDIRTSDKSINQRVIVYNAAKGMKINYSSGKTKIVKTSKKTAKKKSNNASQKKKKSKKKAKKKKKKSSNGSRTVYTTATGTKYHYSKSCRGLSRARNIYSESLSDAKDEGYSPCKICAQ